MRERERETRKYFSHVTRLTMPRTKKEEKRSVLPYASLIDHCALTEEENRTI